MTPGPALRLADRPALLQGWIWRQAVSRDASPAPASLTSASLCFSPDTRGNSKPSWLAPQVSEGCDGGKSEVRRGSWGTHMALDGARLPAQQSTPSPPCPTRSLQGTVASSTSWTCPTPTSIPLTGEWGPHALPGACWEGLPRTPLGQKLPCRLPARERGLAKTWGVGAPWWVSHPSLSTLRNHVTELGSPTLMGPKFEGGVGQWVQ